MAKNIKEKAAQSNFASSRQGPYTCSWDCRYNQKAVGTLQANGKGIPEEVKQVGSRDSNSYELFLG